QHPNIVKLKQVVREEQILYFVFEFCETDLHRVIQAQTQRGGRKLGVDGIARMLHGVLTGLGHMHKHGFFHRDIKPDNLLLVSGGGPAGGRSILVAGANPSMVAVPGFAHGDAVKCSVG
ncbi:MAG: protein kinase, partial [Pseudomonadota bacterium]|nr:protein kinase [Pseudomonadota bacterium]